MSQAPVFPTEERGRKCEGIVSEKLPWGHDLNHLLTRIGVEKGCLAQPNRELWDLSSGSSSRENRTMDTGQCFRIRRAVPTPPFHSHNYRGCEIKEGDTTVWHSSVLVATFVHLFVPSLSNYFIVTSQVVLLRLPSHRRNSGLRDE